MVYGLWLSAAGMAANQYRQNVAANNIANIDTVGFKHDLALLVERPVESQEGTGMAAYGHTLLDQLSGGTQVTPTIHSFAQGPAIVTNKGLDVMIDGQGFFQVQTPDGVRYTRAGSFTINSERTLVTAVGGHPVLDDGGGTISIPAGGGAPEIDDKGRIKQGDAIAGTIGVVKFDDLSKLRKQGATLLNPSDDALAIPLTARKLVPRMLEGSTVDPVNGLVDMIEASRAFEMNANLLSLQDSMLGRTVNEIARF